MISGVRRAMRLSPFAALRREEAGGSEATWRTSDVSAMATSPIFSLELSQHPNPLLRQRSSLGGDEVLLQASGGDVSDSQRRLLLLSAPQTDFEAQLLALVHSLKAEREGAVSAPDLAEALSARGYLVRLESGQPRECGKACGRQCLEKLQHTYLVVSGSLNSAVTAPVIVEPQLREHFRIAHSTHAYEALLAAAPAEFVGGPGRLAAIVEVLSSAVAAAFKDQSLPLPPWRRAKSVLSKWGLGPSAAGAKDGATPFNSPTKRAAAVALPPPQPAAARYMARTRAAGPDGRRERPGRHQQQQLPHKGYAAPQLPPDAAQGRGLEAMLEGIGAGIGRGKRQLLEVSRRSSGEASGQSQLPFVVSLSAHASMDMPLEPVVDAVEGLSTALPEPQPLSSRSALQQQIPLPHQQSSSEQSGSSPGVHQPDASPPVHRVQGGSAGSSDGGDELGMLDLGAPPRGGEGPPGSGGAGDRRPRRVVSLLARGLADQAAAAAAPPVVDPAALLQPPAAEAGGAAAGAKPKRSAAWLLGLPHITTVRRIGKADA
ncbi:g10085 [Coccomyxa elongata]